MKRMPIVFSMLFFPTVAGAAEGGTGEFSLATGLIQMLASLALVVGVILLFYYLSSRWLKTVPGGNGVKHYIRVVETRYLAPKKSILLVEVAGEYLLMSSNGGDLRFIKQIDMLEDIEVVDERRAVTFLPPQVRERISSFAMGLPDGLIRCLSVKKSGGVS